MGWMKWKFKITIDTASDVARFEGVEGPLGCALRATSEKTRCVQGASHYATPRVLLDESTEGHLEFGVSSLGRGEVPRDVCAGTQ